MGRTGAARGQTRPAAAAGGPEAHGPVAPPAGTTRATEERETIEAELFHAARLASMAQVATTLVHEIAQPLEAIGNYVEGSLTLLAHKGPDAHRQVEAALTEAQGQIDRACDLVARLRHFIRKSRAERTPMDLNELVRNWSVLWQAFADSHQVRLHCDLAAGLPLVLADRVQVEQVLVNLVQNAIDATADAPRRELAIATRLTGGFVEVAVADTGGGVHGDMVDRLFDPFTTTKSSGLGLGLSICRRIIDEHGGRIWCESGPDGGTVFRFALPVPGGSEPSG
jgi:two-component system, LuxR family, sensor kinase FixL